MKAVLKNQWIAIVAILLVVAYGAWTTATARGPITTVEAIAVLCEDGVAGLDGADGSAGADGADGSDGADGADGSDGADGADGSDGADGADGAQGEQGIQGLCGPQGLQGLQGPQGEPGASGSQGPAGETGPTGPTGPQGPAGVPGQQGIPGVSAVAGSEATYSLQGGTFGTQPTFSSNPLFEGSSIRNGDLVYVRISVDFDNITNFGTGQFFVSLPFAAKYDTTIRNGHLERFSNGRMYPIVGHISAGSDVMTLWYTAGTGQDEEFDHSHPYGLQVQDSFHIAGSYIAED